MKVIFWLFVALVVGALAALSAWVAMLLLGVLAHLTGWHTAISFWACYIITMLLSFFFPRFNREA